MFPFSQSSSESSRHESDQPSATPAEAGVHGSSVSFPEAFLNSSSARDALPEQYRAHFDELRSGILAFCHDFKIPTEALKDLKAFEGQLASKKISQERMQEAVLLFEQLEHLVTHGEPFREKTSEALEYVEQHYHLTEQYSAQVALLEQVGVLENGAITGIDGEVYPVPTLEQIAARLYEREKDLSVKRDQGFTKLLLVPFGMSLDALLEILKQFLLDYKGDHTNFEVNSDEPFWTWEKEGYKGADTGNPPKIVYNPKSFDSKNHQGQTKEEILEKQATDPSAFPGWSIHLLQPSDPTDLHSPGFALIPKEGEGKSYGEKNSRPDIEKCLSVSEYLSFLQASKNDPSSPYFLESGMTPEDWIMAFMTQLTQTGEPMDSYQNNMDGMTYLIGALFPFFKCPVPSIYWDSTVHKVICESVITDCQGTGMAPRFLVTV